jgi:hypothetical protein
MLSYAECDSIPARTKSEHAACIRMMVKVKVKLSLYARKAVKTIQLKLYSSLTSALEWLEWSDSRPGRFIPGERTYRIESWNFVYLVRNEPRIVQTLAWSLHQLLYPGCFGKYLIIDPPSIFHVVLYLPVMPVFTAHYKQISETR